MNILRSMLLKHYPEAIETHGYVTKENRWKLGWDKTHYIDAIVIASAGERVELPEYVYLKKSVSKGDYQLTKGVRGERKIPTGKIKGFRKFDKVEYLGKKTPKLENCKRIQARSSTLCMRVKAKEVTL